MNNNYVFVESLVSLETKIKEVFFAMEDIANKEVTEEPPEDLRLLPCYVCNRTFLPEPLKKHRRICEQVAHKKRKPFDSLKQRLEGTDLAPFIQSNNLKKNFPDKNSQSQYGNNKQSKWKEKHMELVDTIRKAKVHSPKMRHNSDLGESKSSSFSGASSEKNAIPTRGITPTRKASHAASSQTSVNERCPSCDRAFGPKAFDRHVEWCKERQCRIQKSPANIQQAKERLEARIKYRVPPLKQSQRSIVREKYSPTPQKNTPILRRSNTITSVKSTTSIGSRSTASLNGRQKKYVNKSDKDVGAAKGRNNQVYESRFDNAIGDCADNKQKVDLKAGKTFQTKRTVPTKKINDTTVNAGHQGLTISSLCVGGDRKLVTWKDTLKIPPPSDVRGIAGSSRKKKLLVPLCENNLLMRFRYNEEGIKEQVGAGVKCRKVDLRRAKAGLVGNVRLKEEKEAKKVMEQGDQKNLPLLCGEVIECSEFSATDEDMEDTIVDVHEALESGTSNEQGHNESSRNINLEIAESPATNGFNAYVVVNDRPENIERTSDKSNFYANRKFVKPEGIEVESISLDVAKFQEKFKMRREKANEEKEQMMLIERGKYVIPKDESGNCSVERSVEILQSQMGNLEIIERKLSNENVTGFVERVDVELAAVGSHERNVDYGINDGTNLKSSVCATDTHKFTSHIESKPIRIWKNRKKSRKCRMCINCIQRNVKFRRKVASLRYEPSENLLRQPVEENIDEQFEDDPVPCEDSFQLEVEETENENLLAKMPSTSNCETNESLSIILPAANFMMKSNSARIAEKQEYQDRLTCRSLPVIPSERTEEQDVKLSSENSLDAIIPPKKRRVDEKRTNERYVKDLKSNIRKIKSRKMQLDDSPLILDYSNIRLCSRSKSAADLLYLNQVFSNVVTSEKSDFESGNEQHPEVVEHDDEKVVESTNPVNHSSDEGQISPISQVLKTEISVGKETCKNVLIVDCDKTCSVETLKKFSSCTGDQADKLEDTILLMDDDEMMDTRPDFEIDVTVSHTTECTEQMIENFKEIEMQSSPIEPCETRHSCSYEVIKAIKYEYKNNETDSDEMPMIARDVNLNDYAELDSKFGSIAPSTLPRIPQLQCQLLRKFPRQCSDTTVKLPVIDEKIRCKNVGANRIVENKGIGDVIIKDVRLDMETDDTCYKNAELSVGRAGDKVKRAGRNKLSDFEHKKKMSNKNQKFQEADPLEQDIICSTESLKAEDLFSVDNETYEEYKKYEEIYLKEKSERSSHRKCKNKPADFGIVISNNKTEQIDRSVYKKHKPKEQKRIAEEFQSPQLNLGERVSKYCHECGNKYPVTSAKFCVECGVKRLIL